MTISNTVIQFQPNGLAQNSKIKSSNIHLLQETHLIRHIQIRSFRQFMLKFCLHEFVTIAIILILILTIRKAPLVEFASGSSQGSQVLPLPISPGRTCAISVIWAIADVSRWLQGGVWKKVTIFCCTLPETNSEFTSENGWLECQLFEGWPIFRCFCSEFQGV